MYASILQEKDENPFRCSCISMFSDSINEEIATNEKLEDFAKKHYNDIVEKLKKLTILMQDVQKAIELIPSIDNQIHKENSPSSNSSLLSDDIEILDSITNEQFEKMKIHSDILDERMPNNHPKSDLYLHWKKYFQRHEGITANDKCWLYDEDPQIKIKDCMKIMPYSSELDLDFWLKN